MHAYIIISSNPDTVTETLNKEVKLDGFKTLEFQMQKIEHARELNKYLSLAVSNPTVIVLKNIQNATEECINALLKNLEEPQDNIVFAIHATNENLILPTIISRCRVIRSSENNTVFDEDGINNFFAMNLNAKSDYLKTYKNRDEILSFCDSLIRYLFKELKTPEKALKFKELTKYAVLYKRSIELNGNINLQSLNFLANISN